MERERAVNVLFGKWLKDARGAKSWSQTDMAKQLHQQLGTKYYGSTIAKIEAGDRPLKLAELVAVAELFEVSVDTLLRREARPRGNQAQALRVVADTATKSSVAIVNVESAIQDRLADLAAFDDLPERDTLIASLKQAYSLLVDADGALTDVFHAARKSALDVDRLPPRGTTK